MNSDDRSTPLTNRSDASALVDSGASLTTPERATPSATTSAFSTAGAWPPPSPSNASAPVYAQPTTEPSRPPQPTPVYAVPAYGQPALQPSVPYAQPSAPYAQPYELPQAPYALAPAPAQPVYPTQPVHAQPAPYAPPPMPSAYAAPPYPMPMPTSVPASVVQVIVPQQPMPQVAMPMTMPMSSAMVPYGYAQPTGIVRVGHANRTVFAILAFLFGFIGMHKFYQGKPVWGLIYLLTFWTGVPAMVSVIEGLIALFQSDAAFDAENNLRVL